MPTNESMEENIIGELEIKILKALEEPTEENVDALLEGHPADLVVAMENVKHRVDLMRMKVTLSDEQIEDKLVGARLHLTNLLHEMIMEITRKSLGNTSCPFSDCIELLDLIDDLTKYEWLFIFWLIIFCSVF